MMSTAEKRTTGWRLIGVCVAAALTFGCGSNSSSRNSSVPGVPSTPAVSPSSGTTPAPTTSPVTGTIPAPATSPAAGSTPAAGTNPTTATVLFSRDVLPIFTNNGAKTCAQSGCHSGSNPTGGMNLAAGSAYANIVNVASMEIPALKRVKPGDSANSYLFRKVSSGLMPLAGGPLSAADINKIKTWIDQGAMNN
jgi:hypothetical protein